MNAGVAANFGSTIDAMYQGTEPMSVNQECNDAFKESDAAKLRAELYLYTLKFFGL